MKKILYFISLLLLSLTPVLTVTMNNLSKINLNSLIFPILLCAGFSFLAITLFYLIVRNDDLAMVLASLLTVAFFFYGDFYAYISAHVKILVKFEHLLPLSFWLIGFAAVGVLIWKKPSTWKPASLYLILLPFVLNANAIFRIVNLQVVAASSAIIQESDSHTPSIGKPVAVTSSQQSKPDIYYIILDSYGRSDILEELYGFNNSEFINYLKQKGFYVAEQSESNYAQTRLSLTSSLNMDYLDQLLDPDLPDDLKFTVLQNKWENNAAFKTADELGYTTVFVDVGMNFSKYTQADIVYRPNVFDDLYKIMLSKTILLLIKTDFEIREEQRAFHSAVQHILKVPDIRESTFAFLHILYPHLPYIFDRNGKFPSFPNAKLNYKLLSWMPDSAYIDQLVYINKQTMRIIDTILEKSDTQPVIILQADHGPQYNYQEPKARLAILNAFYLPDNGEENLYPSISPVNTFRVIFDTYLGTQFGLLEDISWFSMYNASASGISDNFDFCQATNLYLSPEEIREWAVSASDWLVTHKYFIEMQAKECDLAQFTQLSSGFRGLETSENFRWAGKDVLLKMPVVEKSVDHILKLHLRNALVYQEDLKVQLLVNGNIIKETQIKNDYSHQTVSFVVPVEELMDNDLVELKIHHTFSQYINGLGDISVRYHGIEWMPETEAEIPARQENEIVEGSILLGPGWHDLENENGRLFRWVDNNAEFVVYRVGAASRLQLVVKPGPGLSYEPFTLYLLDSDGIEIDQAEVPTNGVVYFVLPLGQGDVGKYQLFVKNGKQGFAPNDNRVLNFRVFSLALVE